ncbi:MAG: hypothetical protein HC803_06160 [Saprospiraceae bacterium]|nr:hypothetical protein [Saprospiraceae bacterium]
MNYTKAYLIYCIENKNIANNLSNDLKRIGIEFTHDIFNPSEHAYIRQQYLNSYAPIFLLVSDNFLKSENCMKNILELVEDSRLKGRIKTIILEGRERIEGTNQYQSVPTKFERLGDVVNYINYWSVQYQAIRTEMRHTSDERKEALEPQLHLIQDISTNILGDFMRYLRGTNYVTYKRLENDNFRQLFDEFGGKGATLLSEYKSLPIYIPPIEIVEKVIEEEVIDVPEVIETAAEVVENTIEITEENTDIIEDSTTEEIIEIAEEYTTAVEDIFDNSIKIEDEITEKVADVEDVIEDITDINLSDIPGIGLLPTDEESEGEQQNDDDFYTNFSDDLLDDLAEEIVSDDESEDIIADDIINEVFGDMDDLDEDESDSEHSENSLKDLINELADDILDENNIIEDEEDDDEKGEPQADLEGLEEEIIEETEIVEEKMSDDTPLLQGESPEHIDDFMDEIATDLVNEMDETPTKFEPLVEGEEVEDEDYQEVEDDLQNISTMDVAEKLAASGDIKGATGLYNQLIENAPKDLDLRYAFAMILLENNGDIELAKEQLLVANDLDNEDEDVLFALGAISEQEGDYDAAKSYYERVILLDLEHEQAYYRLGSLLANCFENQEFVASSYLQRALSLDDEYAEAYFEYAKLLK